MGLLRLSIPELYTLQTGAGKMQSRPTRAISRRTVGSFATASWWFPAIVPRLRTDDELRAAVSTDVQLEDADIREKAPGAIWARVEQGARTVCAVSMAHTLPDPTDAPEHCWQRLCRKRQVTRIALSRKPWRCS